MGISLRARGQSTICDRFVIEDVIKMFLLDAYPGMGGLWATSSIFADYRPSRRPTDCSHLPSGIMVEPKEVNAQEKNGPPPMSRKCKGDLSFAEEALACFTLVRGCGVDQIMGSA